MFFLGKSYALILAKLGLGYVLGNFFTNASGHPGRVARWFLFRPKLSIRIFFGGLGIENFVA
jgi:hypothetical protein